MFYTLVLHACFTRLFYTLVLHACFTRLFYTLVLHACFIHLFYTLVLYKFKTCIFTLCSHIFTLLSNHHAKIKEAPVVSIHYFNIFTTWHSHFTQNGSLLVTQILVIIHTMPVCYIAKRTLQTIRLAEPILWDIVRSDFLPNIGYIRYLG